VFQQFLDSYLAPQWRHGKAIGHSVQEWSRIEDADVIIAALRAALEAGTVQQGETPLSPFSSSEMIYRRWEVTPIREKGEEITHLLLTTSNVTSQVVARKQAEQMTCLLDKAHREAEVERKRLAVIEAVARSVRTSIDLQQISEAATDALYTSLLPLTITIYSAEAESRALHEVSRRTNPQTPATFTRIFSESNTIAYDSIVIEDMQAALATGEADVTLRIHETPTRGFVCVPLWFKDSFEGTINALFCEPIQRNGSEVQTLIGCSTHIAAALAHARLHKAVEEERARLQEDIKQRKTMEQQKNEFLSIASHELRTPITSIQGFAELLNMLVARGKVQTPQSTRALRGILEGSQRLNRLIEELLDLSRLEKDQLVINVATHDLSALVAHVVEEQELISKQHHFEMVMEGLHPNEALLVDCDENRLVQVFTNLLSNAVKYSPLYSQITVGLCCKQEMPHEVVVWVKDQGIGIPQDELPHIFERFHRARTLDRSISGMGIGLYLVKEVVTRHGGSVWAEQNVGEVGSTFYVKLPV
jgi:signal transduction histidine kinase